MGPAYRVQFHGSDHIIRTASFSAFSFYIQNLAKILVELEFWIFKSDPNLVVDISLNKDYSGDSNGGIYVSIPALGDEKRNLPCFCLPILPRKSPSGTGSYCTPLERNS